MKDTANYNMNKKNTKDMNEMNNNKSNNNMKKNIILIGILVLILSFVGYSVYLNNSDYSLANDIVDAKAKAAQDAFNAKKEAELRKLLEEKEANRVSDIKADYEQRYANEIAKSQGKMNSLITNGVTYARGFVRPTADKFGSFGVLKDVLYYQVVDTVCGSNDCDAYVENLTGTQIINACVDVEAKLSAELSSLSLRLNELANNMKSDLIEGVPEQLKTPEYEMSLSTYVGSISNDVASIKLKSLSMGSNIAWLVVDGVFIYFGRESFKNLVTRGAASLGISIGVSVADGPLPIGDVIGAALTSGFMILAAWDLYWLADNAADDIATNLNYTLNSYESSLKTNLNKNIANIKAQLASNI